METHAVPQDIMGMEFKLFGNFLSVREFTFIAVGIGTAYFFYFLMQRGILPGVLAIPAVLFFGLGGILIGLVPIQDRSLDKWIVNYFNAIGRPTQRVWKKPGFEPTASETTTDGVITKNHVVTPPAQDQPEIFKAGTSNTPPTADAATIEAEKDESEDLQRITSTMTQIETGTAATSTPVAVSSTPASPPAASNKTISTAPTAPKIAPASAQTRQTTPAPPTPAPTQQAKTQPAPVAKNPQPVSQKPPAPQPAPQRPPAPQPKVKTPTPQTAIQSQPPTPKPPVQQQPQDPAKTNPKEPASNILTIDDNNISTYATTITGATNKPNTINIVTKDAQGLIVPGTVCVIKNSQGEPVRASISNVLGQILNNVPLKAGTYKINLSKEGYVYPEITRILTGRTYPPIEIKAL